MQYSKNPSLSIFTKARYLRIVFIVDISDTSFNKIFQYGVADSIQLSHGIWCDW